MNLLTLIVSIFTISAVFLSPSGLANASSNSTNPTEEAIETLTSQTIANGDTYNKGNKTERGFAQSKLTYLVNVRKAKMETLIKEDPEKFLLMSLPSSVRNTLPKELQDNIEESVEIEGQVNVVVLDSFNQHTSEIMYSLEDSSKPSQRYRLYFARGTPDLTTGTRVRVKGVKLSKNSDLVAVLFDGHSSDSKNTSSDLTILQAPIAKTVSSINSAGANAPVTLPENRKILFILVNFQDMPLDLNYCSASNIEQKMFEQANGINNYYLETSFGKVTFSATNPVDFAGPYTINASEADSCNRVYQWNDMADQMARNNGYNLESYQHIVHEYPAGGCYKINIGGLAEIGGHWVSMFGICNLPFALSHELGHNLGMAHSTQDGGEYSDASDVMGSEYHLLNGPHMVQMGWTPQDNITTITTSGSYTIYPLHNSINMTQVLKIPVPYGHNYYLSLRKQTGTFDFSLNGPYSSYVGATIHQDGHEGIKTKLLQVLNDGAVFDDVANGIRIQQLSHDSAGNQATVAIDFYTPSCLRTPTLTISPITQTGWPGRTLAYFGQLRNNDLSFCSPSVFSIVRDDNGIISSFTVDPKTLSPGQTTGFFLGLTANTSIPLGTYPVQFKTFHVTNPDLSSSASVSYVVAAKPYDQWRAQKFTQLEIADPSPSNITLENADPDNDGIINLLEYLFNLEPKFNASSEFQFSIVDDYYILKYRINENASDVIAQIETSTNSVNWGPILYASGSSQRVDNSTRLQTTTDGTPVSVSGTRYYRLKVTKADSAATTYYISPSLAVLTTLTVIKSGPGTVTSSSGNINCGSTCSVRNFGRETTETLRAYPDAGYRFDGFTGGCSSSTATTCTVSFGSSAQVRASFVESTPPTGYIGVSKLASPYVYLTLTANDQQSGMYPPQAQMKFSNDNNVWSTPEPYALTKVWPLSSGYGSKTVYVKYKDVAGNWSIPYSVSFSTQAPDTTPPSGYMRINSSSATTTSITVTLSLYASDSGGSVTQMQFSNNNSTWSSPEVYSTSKVWNLSAGYGPKTVYVKFKDAAGNWSNPTSANITYRSP